jgi:UDP-N-acetylglucosamine 4,6-dehydratase
MRLMDVVHAVAKDTRLIDIVGLRPGEKRHEALVSEQEAARSIRVGDYTLIAPPDENWSTLPTGTPAVAMTSDAPARFIRAAEMADMIEDAKDV